MDALALLREEAGVHALVVERLDQLPLHPADHVGGPGPGPRCHGTSSPLAKTLLSFARIPDSLRYE
jgi:hypothetical protein